MRKNADWAWFFMLVLAIPLGGADHVVWTFTACLYPFWLLVWLLIDVNRIEAKIKDRVKLGLSPTTIVEEWNCRK